MTSMEQDASLAHTTLTITMANNAYPLLQVTLFRSDCASLSFVYTLGLHPSAGGYDSGGC